MSESQFQKQPEERPGEDGTPESPEKNQKEQLKLMKWKRYKDYKYEAKITGHKVQSYKKYKIFKQLFLNLLKLPSKNSSFFFIFSFFTKPSVLKPWTGYILVFYTTQKEIPLGLRKQRVFEYQVVK